MDNTEKARELINKHLYLHGGDGLGISDGNVYRAVLDAVSEALTIPDVVGQSEQLKCEHKYQDIRYGTSRCVICGEEEQIF